MSHTPYLFTEPEEWEKARAIRRADGAIADDVPIESLGEMREKKKRVDAAFEALRREFRAARPDVAIVFGDDQLEQYAFSGFPAFSVYCGDTFEGFKISPKFGLPIKGPRPSRPRDAEHWVSVSGHPVLARSLMTGLVKEGFDPAFSLSLANQKEGLGHAFMRPLLVLTGDAWNVPAVPVSINCYYGPQPTGERCWELGRAVRDIVSRFPPEMRVAVIGSGGLWHTPLRPRAILDGTFDDKVLASVRSGNAKAMSLVLDELGERSDPNDVESVMIESGGTGMVLGVGLGTGEVRNWIAAAAAADGTPGTVVDYIPIYASPVGAGFAYFKP